MGGKLIKTENGLIIESENLCELAFVLFFCNPLLTRWVQSVLYGTKYVTLRHTIPIVITYACVLLAFSIDRSRIPEDFFGLLLLICLFFIITYAIHPEYKFWYTRSYYGVYDYVLRPNNGLYAFFFIRLINNPKKILKLLNISSWIMYPYYMYLLAIALKRGYWVNTGARGQVIHMSYDLSFGYDVVFFTLVFLLCFVKYRKVVDLTMVAIGIIMIILGGSRGPLVCILAFILLTVLIRILHSDNSLLYGTLFSLIVATSYALRDLFLAFLKTILELTNSSSRTIQMILEGDIADDNGRKEIWNAAIEMIKRKPWGYGAMGTRHVIYYIHDVGHCHELFLELLVDFGVLVGGIIITYIIFRVLTIIFGNIDGDWRGIYLVFLCRALQLLISGTYWHVFSFWACMGIDVCIYYAYWTEKSSKAVHYKYLKTL